MTGPDERRTDRQIELLLFTFTLFAYVASSDGMLLHPSQAPHFMYQAQAFLQGQLQLATPPPDLNDWARVGQRWYVSFPPFPAVLMLPGVALWGLRFYDVAFTLVFAAVNVPLAYRVFRQLDEEGVRQQWQTAAHALVFGFGTVVWSCSIRGEVWFTAHVVGVTLTLLYLSAAQHARRPLAAGLALACAAITRTPLAFSAIFFLGEAMTAGGRWDLDGLRAGLAGRAGRMRALRAVLLFSVPVAAIGAAMAWMNAARFGDPGEFGHRYLFDNRVNDQIRAYGLFSFHFLERNLHAAFTRLPALQLHPLKLTFDGEGMSLLVTTPLLALLLWPERRPRLHRPLWLTAAVIAVPGFLYQNSGYYQFGYRFSMDYTPYLVALLSIGARPMSGAWWALAGAGVSVNAWGAAVFNRPR